jgi:ATP-dependent DNA helicase DinG
MPAMSGTIVNTREQLLALIFSKDGLLSRSLRNFEERPCQKEMAEVILDAYSEEKLALVEAGTGTGKSLAYLVPAVYWALKHQEKTVIATHTIALQEQLFLKDIPFLLKLMDIDIQACLVKGMGNYLCLRKLQELQSQPLLFSMDEAKEMQAIEHWAEHSAEGSRSDLNFPVHSHTWEKVAAERESCNHVRCPHYKKCFFFKARKQAEESQLLVVNHHLLLADIEKQRRGEQESILPSYQRLIIDEAHQLEDVALESFAQRLDRIQFLRQLAKMHSEAHPERSRLTLLRAELSVYSTKLSPVLLQKLDTEFPAQKQECQVLLEETFAQLIQFLNETSAREKDLKRRITKEISQNPFWQNVIAPGLRHLAEAIQRLSIGLAGISFDLEEFEETPFYEKLAPHLLDLQTIVRKLEQTAKFLEQFSSDEPQEKRVRWVEIQDKNVVLMDAALDISDFLQEHLFSERRTSVLCSATMATSRSFHFLKRRLGLDNPEIKIREEIFDSPFNYKERTLLAVPTDLCLPSDPGFNSECAQAMAEAIAVSQGSVFLLFTSYDMLQNCYRLLLHTDLSQRYPFLKQGDLPRHVLLEQFKRKEGSVLFATDSFWEGVDVPGEALRCVVIAKLPFSVPNDPLYEAYAQSLEKDGLDPFYDYTVPNAVIKFKQGFGRLMRKHTDRGCVLCLDQRMVKKSYGKFFLKSLPDCETCFAPKETVFSEMKRFYKRTSPSHSNSGK